MAQELKQTDKWKVTLVPDSGYPPPPNRRESNVMVK